MRFALPAALAAVLFGIGWSFWPATSDPEPARPARVDAPVTALEPAAPPPAATTAETPDPAAPAAASVETPVPVDTSTEPAAALDASPDQTAEHPADDAAIEAHLEAERARVRGYTDAYHETLRREGRSEDEIAELAAAEDAVIDDWRGLQENPRHRDPVRDEAELGQLLGHYLEWLTPRIFRTPSTDEEHLNPGR